MTKLIVQKYVVISANFFSKSYEENFVVASNNFVPKKV
jgi:hypothetical protein